MNRLAALGGPPCFPDGVPFVRPSLPPLEDVVRELTPSYDSGQITDGRLVRRLEDEIGARLGAPHVVAVASCTVGLMLVIRALGVDRPVVVPSFTFAASVHAVAWNGATPRFAECDPETFQIDVADANRKLDGAGALLATHVFGAPCSVEELQRVAGRAGIPLLFDAAHALGASRRGRPTGLFGAAEVFSLTPTKPLVAGEGGLVTTSDGDLAETVRVARNYGNPGDYDSRLLGLNGRMSEFHAATALASLRQFDEDLAHRRSLAARYQAGLAGVPGIRVQKVDADDCSTWKDLTVRVDRDTFGLSRDQVVQALAAEGVDTRRYFWPPIHRHRIYRDLHPAPLPTTDAVSSAVVSLPVWPGLATTVVDQVVELLGRLHEHSDEIRHHAA
jgi:dTDP-4-amino-4,6-dideoxygalactose transaminase